MENEWGVTSHFAPREKNCHFIIIDKALPCVNPVLPPNSITRLIQLQTLARSRTDLLLLCYVSLTKNDGHSRRPAVMVQPMSLGTIIALR